MSTLGEILSDLNDREIVFSLLAEGGDIAAIAGVNEAANASGRDPCDLAMDAVEAFTLKADDEAWVKLIGRIQNADSPGGACLSEIITWSLAR
jgi:hypothetical protein